MKFTDLASLSQERVETGEKQPPFSPSSKRVLEFGGIGNFAADELMRSNAACKEGSQLAPLRGIASSQVGGFMRRRSSSLISQIAHFDRDSS